MGCLLQTIALVDGQFEQRFTHFVLALHDTNELLLGSGSVVEYAVRHAGEVGDELHHRLRIHGAQLLNGADVARGIVGTVAGIVQQCKRIGALVLLFVVAVLCYYVAVAEP